MSLNYSRTGQGPGVLLLHAGVADARMWDVPVKQLHMLYDLLAPDFRGYGQTPLDSGQHYADAVDVLGLLDDLEISDVAAVGASYGAHVLLQAASQQPERFRQLVLLCPFVESTEPTADIQEFWDHEDQLLADDALDAAATLNVDTWLGPEADDDTRDLVWQMQRHAFALQAVAGDVDDYELDIDLDRIDIPVQVFSGAHDLAFFARGAEQLTAKLPQAKHTVLPWAGHLPTLELPDDGITLLQEALA